MIPVFLLATLLGAGLLFLVQPMVAKMLLPSLGGSPAVWNTCMVLFQALLLAGYSYAHLLTSWVKPRAQVLVHGALLLAALAFLPLSSVAAHAGAEGSPVLWIMRTLGATVAVPFFVLATTGPLLQRWLASTDHPRGRDPYFLYAASNLSSLGALLAYPFLLEPYLPLASTAGVASLGSRWTQTTVWSWGFAAYGALGLACAAFTLRGRPPAPMRAAPGAEAAHVEGAPVGWRRRLLWTALAFVPSSAMLGTTLALTTDVAAVPLLWILPLGIYLLTFVLAFSPRIRVPPRPVEWALGLLALGVAANTWLFTRPSTVVGLLLYPSALAAVGLVCHGRLAADRPPPARLTEYYFWIAMGGVLGGVFNALIAPVLFTSVAEYPIALVLACLLRPARRAVASPSASRAERRRTSRSPKSPDRERRALILDVALPLLLAAGIAWLHSALRGLGAQDAVTRVQIEASIACLACLAFIRRPMRFAAGLAVIFVAVSVFGSSRNTIYTERTFFGVLRVKRVEAPLSRQLLHGTTLHGMQLLHPSLRLEPTSYYHRTGPIGDVFRTFRASPLLGDVAVVGLGVGSLAAYGEPGQRFTFYEIDPEVIRIARDPELFTYLRDSRAEVRTIVGDGRLSLAAEPDGRFGLIAIDAFSSDSVPVHLITREAVALYLRKLRPAGILALHLSSGNFDLVPVVADAAASLGKSGLEWCDTEIKPQEAVTGKYPSCWAVIAPGASALDPLRAEPHWRSLAETRSGAEAYRLLWTDNHSSPLTVLRHW